ncbi:unnamed protein product [Schistocephalus solidus]|uniref:FLYWCH-type domain-containing protein n=1 Tax=Schistocephalus solidus TaxID=70667 RepID=A0A183SQB4_SCHSO|nr:unnamed protein product [Schistocephalus solidus]
MSGCGESDVHDVGLMVPTDSTPDLEQKFTASMCSGQFGSFEEFESTLKNLEKETGMLFIRSGSFKIKTSPSEAERFRYYRMRYVCKHGGTSRASWHLTNGRRTYKCGCNSYFEVLLRPKGFEITKYNMQHSHLTSKPLASHYPENRRLTREEECLFKDLILDNTDNKGIRNVMLSKRDYLCGYF